MFNSITTNEHVFERLFFPNPAKNVLTGFFDMVMKIAINNASILFLFLLLGSLASHGQVKSRYPSTRHKESGSLKKPDIMIKNQLETSMILAGLPQKILPYLTMNELRTGKADTAGVVFVISGLKSGIFKYNKANSTSPDDSSLVVCYGKRRYEREYSDMKPEYFGANSNDTLDDGPAIQRALNSATKKGLSVVFSAGTYISSVPLKPKVVVPAPAFGYKLKLEGAGSGLTIIKAEHNQEMVQIVQGQKSFIGRESDLLIKNIAFDGNGIARHCIRANYIAGLKILDCRMTGATWSNIKIGDTNSENYGIDIIRCYSGGLTAGEAHNEIGIELINSRYVYIDRLTTDGSKYGIYLKGSDKSFVTNCHLEGNKVASIYIEGTGGGEHKISNNMFMPYVQYEASAKFDGKLEGVHLEGKSGGGAANIIYGNVFIVPNPMYLPVKSMVSKSNKLLKANPIFVVKGTESNATGNLIGFDQSTGKALIQVLTGNFRQGEIIKQSGTGGSATLGEIIKPLSIAVSTKGAANSCILSNNQIRLNPSIGFMIESENNIVSNNHIVALTGIYKNADKTILVGNVFDSPQNIAINNIRGELEYSTNNCIGKVLGPSSGSALSRLGQPTVESGNNLTSTDGDYTHILSRSGKGIFELSNNGADNVHLVGLGGATLWLGNDGSSRTAANIGINSNGQIIVPNLPKSSKGLPSGALWLDEAHDNVVKCIP